MYLAQIYHVQNVRQVKIKTAYQEICKSEISVKK
jgi:hypothetical protein